MHWRWFRRPAREQVRSRPRVAQAAAAAHSARQQAPTSLGSATALMAAAFFVPPGGRASTAAIRPTEGLPVGLALETARVGRAAGRSAEEVWAEALREWLAARMDVWPEAQAPRLPTPLDGRRQRAWAEIEHTLQALRAG